MIPCMFTECLWNTTTDVVMVLDMSTGLSNSDVDTGVSAIAYLTNMILSRDPTNSVRISLVTIAESVSVIRNLSDTSDRSMLLSRINSMVYLEGQCGSQGPDSNIGCNPSIDKLSEALNLLNGSIFDKKNNHAREITVVVTNGGFRVTDEMRRIIGDFKLQERLLVGIAVGDEVSMTNLQQLVDDPAYIFTVKFQEVPTNLDVLSAEIFYSSCSLSNEF